MGQRIHRAHLTEGQFIPSPPQFFKPAIFLSFYMELSSEINFGIYRGLLYLRPASGVQYLQLTLQCYPAGTALLCSQEVRGLTKSRKLNWEFCSENPFSKPAGLAGENGDGKPTLMLSANSSNAFAPVVSMEVINPGNLFFVPAAVPWNSSITDQRKKTSSI